MGSNTYNIDLLKYKRGEIIKTTLSYAYKSTGKSNDVTWSRTLFFQFDEVGSNCTVQRFFDIYIEEVIQRIKRIQSSVVRWSFIKVESVNKASLNPILYPLSGVYGDLNAICDVLKGFQIDLAPSKGSSTKRMYIRGTPDILNLWDHENNPELKNDVQAIERTFIGVLGESSIKKDDKSKQTIEGCSFRFVVPSTLDPIGYETVGSSNAIKLHLFKKREIANKQTKNSPNERTGKGRKGRTEERKG